MEMNIFEKATKIKLRINSSKGVLSVEDLWDLPLTKLNEIAKGINKKIQEQGEVDFLGESGKADPKLVLTLDIIKSIIKIRQQEAKDSENRAIKEAQRERLLKILARKEEESLNDLSKEELEKLLSNL